MMLIGWSKEKQARQQRPVQKRRSWCVIAHVLRSGTGPGTILVGKKKRCLPAQAAGFVTEAADGKTKRRTACNATQRRSAKQPGCFVAGTTTHTLVSTADRRHVECAFRFASAGTALFTLYFFLFLASQGLPCSRHAMR